MTVNGAQAQPVPQDQQHVLIVGAGPVGLFTALKLVRANIPSTVIERGASTSRAPRACGYFGGTLLAMNEVGTFGKVLAKGYIARNLSWTGLPVDDGKGGKRAGDIVAVQPTASPDDDLTTPHAGTLVLPQSDLTALLLEEALQTGKVEVLFNLDLQAIEDDGDTVTAVLKNTQNNTVQRVTGSFLLGADGGSSRTRKLLDIHLVGHTWPERVVTTDVEKLCSKTSVENPIQYTFAPEHYTVIVALTKPVPGQQALFRYAMAHAANDPLSDEELLSDSHIHDLYEEVMEGARPLQYEIHRRSIYHVHQRCATTMRRGRCLLAGDAAHLNNPIGAMGLNSGLLDADAAAETLIMIINEGHPLDLLDTYNDERRRVFQTFVDPRSTQNKLRLQHNTPETAVRDDYFFRKLQNLTPEEVRKMYKPFVEVWRTDVRTLAERKV